MDAIINPIITKLYEQESLTQEESQQLFDIIIRGELDPILMASALTALKIKGETPDEIAGAAKALLANANPFPRPDYDFADIVAMHCRRLPRPGTSLPRHKRWTATRPSFTSRSSTTMPTSAPGPSAVHRMPRPVPPPSGSASWMSHGRLSHRPTGWRRFALSSKCAAPKAAPRPRADKRGADP